MASPLLKGDALAGNHRDFLFRLRLENLFQPLGDDGPPVFRPPLRQVEPETLHLVRGSQFFGLRLPDAVEKNVALVVRSDELRSDMDRSAQGQFVDVADVGLDDHVFMAAARLHGPVVAVHPVPERPVRVIADGHIVGDIHVFEHVDPLFPDRRAEQGQRHLDLAIPRHRGIINFSHCQRPFQLGVRFSDRAAIRSARAIDHDGYVLDEIVQTLGT